MSTWPEHDLSAYRELIEERGEHIRWWRGSKCACYNPATGAHNTKCPVCGGSSVRYDEQDISAYKALVRSAGEHSEFVRQGLVLANDVSITTMPDEIQLGQRDIIMLAARSYRYSETIVRSDTNQDRLHIGPVSQLLEVRDLNTQWFEGSVSFTNVDFDKAYLTWEQPPVAGHVISVTYYHSPVFVVMPDIGLVRRTVADGQLPQKVFARLKNPEGIN